MRVPMIRTTAGKYGTRQLKAGEPFDALPGHARVLSTLGRARYADVVEPVPPAPPEPTEEVERLRRDYESLAGKKPHHMWRVPRLRSEVDRLLAAESKPE